MTEPLLAALRAVRDEMTKLRVVEVGILNLLGGEPMPQPKSAGVADLPDRPEPKPRRRYIGNRGPNPHRNRVAELMAGNGAQTVRELMSHFPDLEQQKLHNLVCGCDWFERMPGTSPAAYRLSDIGREEYAKAKAEGSH